MAPTIVDGGLYFANQLIPYIKEYKVGNIVIFKHKDKIRFSRIVALGKNSIQIREKEIIINGVPINDGISRTWNDWNYGTYAINKTLKIPEDHVYVLSDNLSAQYDDSRVFGPIHNSSIFEVIW